MLSGVRSLQGPQRLNAAGFEFLAAVIVMWRRGEQAEQATEKQQTDIP